MRTVCNQNQCNGCMACVEKCPKQCISIKDSVFYYNAVIEWDKCINCDQCKRCCPNVSAPERKKPIKWYQGWAQQEIRTNATSGGVASALIKKYIDSGDYVASCIFSEGEFKFEITNSYERARLFTGSKYVKSNPSGIYGAIQEKMKTKKVLFIGLPCQVAALKKYIKKQDNLLTIDLICHGTPSPKLLDSFLREKGYSLSKLSDIRFREKTNMGIRIGYTALSYERVTDDYLLTFLKSITYTENCYSCKYASIERVGDITLGDSWGTDLKDQEKKGISLVLINTEKGIGELNGCDLELFDVDIENAIANNHQLQSPSEKGHERVKFMRTFLRSNSFRKAAIVSLPKIAIKERIKTLLISLHIVSQNISGGGIK